jgi:hypothetical protein
MRKLRYVVLTAAAAALFAACGAPAGNAPTNNANAANTAAAPTKDALMANESKAWESWKAKDGKYFEDYLTDNVIAISATGRIDKATIVKRHIDPTCEVKAFSLTEEKMTPLGADAALLTYKATQDAQCGGKKLPSPVWAATVLVRSGERWKAAYHNEVAIVDPKAAPARTEDNKDVPKKVEPKRAIADSNTDAMITAEKALWEAWKDHDGKRIDELTAKDISFVNIFGTYFATKADALKDWTSPGCDVKTVSVSDAASTMLSPTAAILVFKGGADGTCFGQKVGPIWGTSIYVKNGDTWKWTFGMNVPAG